MGIQCTKMKCRRFGLSTFWLVDVSVCRRFGLSTFWFVDVLFCRRFGLSTFWFVDVSVCRRFGLSTFLLSTFRFVDVLTSYQLKDMLVKHGRYTSLDSKPNSQWNAANMPTPQLPMHRVLCSLIHSHSISHLNYWNMCRLGCATCAICNSLGTN